MLASFAWFFFGLVLLHMIPRGAATRVMSAASSTAQVASFFASVAINRLKSRSDAFRRFVATTQDAMRLMNMQAQMNGGYATELSWIRNVAAQMTDGEARVADDSGLDAVRRITAQIMHGANPEASIQALSTLINGDEKDTETRARALTALVGDRVVQKEPHRVSQLAHQFADEDSGEEAGGEAS